MRGTSSTHQGRPYVRDLRARFRLVGPGGEVGVSRLNVWKTFNELLLSNLLTKILISKYVAFASANRGPWMIMITIRSRNSIASQNPSCDYFVFFNRAVAIITLT